MMLSQLVLTLLRKSECQARSRYTIFNDFGRYVAADILPTELSRPVMRQIYSALTIYVLLHVLKCLVCKLNSLWRLLNEKMCKNVISYKYLMPMIADILILDVIVFYSVHQNRGLTFYFIVFKDFHNKSLLHLSVTRVYCLLQGNLCLRIYRIW